MRRAVRIGLVLLVTVLALLVVNAVVIDDETRDAEVTAPGGEVVELDGADLQVVDRPASGEGREGRPIVLLHCFGCSGRWWDPLVPLLNERHRVVTIDLIGHGGSEKPSSGYEITAQSAAVAGALNQLGVEGATVVGHSLGGSVATSLAEQASQLVDRVVLIGTASERGQVELPLTARLSTVPLVGEAIWRIRFDSIVKSGYADAFAPGFDVEDVFADPDRVVADNEAMTYTSFEEARAAGADFLDESSTASRLTATGVPLLAIGGSEDQILDTEQALTGFEAVPGARIEELDGVGHSPNVEDPEAVAELILPFAAAGGTLDAEPAPGPSPAPQGRPGGAGERSPSEPRPEPGRKRGSRG